MIDLIHPPVRNILRVSASARTERSRSRELTDLATGLLRTAHPRARIVERDLAEGVEQLDAAWVAANLTSADERDLAQRERLALSDRLIGELEAADIVVIGTPIYNFALPAALKAWIDLVVRSKRTFRYGPDGPEGLLVGKRALVAMVSGGTAIGSDVDFASGHLDHILRFMGITEIAWLHADQLFRGDTEANVAAARERMHALVPVGDGANITA